MSCKKILCTFTGALLALAATLQLASPGFAQSKPGIEVSKYWLRETPPSAMAGAGFMLITNSGSQDDRLVSVKFAGSNRSEIHTMKMNNGVMEMRPLENGIEVAAGKSALLEPGANHLMFMGLKNPLTKGVSHSVKLVFENAGEITVNFPVLAFPAGKKLMQQKD